MKTILSVEKSIRDGKQGMFVSYPDDHPQIATIEKLLDEVSPGYVEYWLQNGMKPICFSCKKEDCPKIGSDEEACKLFKIGIDW